MSGVDIRFSPSVGFVASAFLIELNSSPDQLTNLEAGARVEVTRKWLERTIDVDRRLAIELVREGTFSDSAKELIRSQASPVSLRDGSPGPAGPLAEQWQRYLQIWNEWKRASLAAMVQLQTNASRPPNVDVYVTPHTDAVIYAFSRGVLLVGWPRDRSLAELLTSKEFLSALDGAR